MDEDQQAILEKLAKLPLIFPSVLHVNLELVAQHRERWFREITDKMIRRGVIPSVPDLVSALELAQRAPQ